MCGSSNSAQRALEIIFAEREASVEGAFHFGRLRIFQI
jgi:hypothetical protein